MPDLSRSELAAYAVCAVLVALLGWRALKSEHPSLGATPPTAGTASSPRSSNSAGVSVQAAPVAQEAVVHVVGAVRRPGVYRLRTDQRVQDAVQRAGGASGSADLEAINLAAKLADGQQVIVPRRGVAGTALAGDAAGAGAGAAGGAAAPAAPVSLNTATADQLETLDGVGPATAQKIIEYRTQHGGFRSVDDLANVPGIGPKKLAALRPKVQA